MDYKEKYEQALEKAQKMQKNSNGMILKKWLWAVFPELAESEDERIRKEIIDFLGLPHPQFVGKRDHEKWIAWLEKQSEKKGYTFKSIPRLLDMIVPSEKAKFYCQKLIDTLTKEGYDTDAKIVSNCLKQMNGEEVAIATMDEDEKQGENKSAEDDKMRREILELVSISGIDYNQYEEIKDWLEKQGENKPTDKIEPKFKVGDWIVFNGLILHIDEVVNGYYRTTSIGDGIHNSYDWDIDNAARLWTIQEAKDGDVLTTDNFIFIFKSIDNNNGVHYYCHYEISKHEDDSPQFGVALPQSLMGIVGSSFTHYKPATKEQRELLFQKMKEAGYEWDANKKELKKMEVVSKESEDERIRKEIIDFVKSRGGFKGDWIAWLEKQADKDKLIRELGEYKVKYTQKVLQEDLNKNTESQSQPKFKLRDWIVDDFGNYWRVVKVRPNYYEIEGDDGVGSIPTRKWVDEKYHLWTIDDAKKGDILVVDGIWIVEFDKKMTDGCPWNDTSILTSFEYDMDDDICTPGSHMFYKEIWPASKEDIDLFKKKRNEYLASNLHNESNLKVGDRVVINCREEFATAYNGKEGTIINIFDLEKNHWGNIVVVLDNGMRNTFYASELIKK